MSAFFRPVKEYEDLYLVSDNGDIWSFVTNKLLKKNLVSSGYFQVTLTKNKKRSNYLVHRLVLLTFGGLAPLGKKCVNHKNGIKTDNHYLNLEWVSYKENMLHAKKNGLVACGQKNGNSKLTADLIEEIRKKNELTYTEIGKRYGISRTQVSNIINQRQWQR